MESQTALLEKDILGRDEKMHLLALASAVGPVSFHRLIAAFGSPDGVFGATLEEWTRVGSHKMTEENFRALVKGPDRGALQALEETCALQGIRILTYRCEGYPAPLLDIFAPPPVIYVQGSWRPEDARALAVVGTRHPTAYGLRAGRNLCVPVAERGWTLVSGLARGIDTMAHECALSAGARTIAVVGTGLDLVYPRENAGLAARIVAEGRGCVISEFPLGTHPTPHNFPRRNRLISALTRGTLVVEAGLDSGALITAEYALEQGREIFAVPGDIQSPASRGTHYLLREGAHVATCADEILAVLDGLGLAVPARRFAPDAPAMPARPGKAAPRPMTEAPPPAAPARPPEPRPEALPEPLASVLALLTTKAQSLEALAALADADTDAGREPLPPRALLPALLALEMRGKVRRLPGALYRLP